jgi:hypothetical protein
MKWTSSLAAELRRRQLSSKFHSSEASNSIPKSVEPAIAEAPTVLEGTESAHAKSLYDFTRKVVSRVDEIEAAAPQGVIQIQ